LAAAAICKARSRFPMLSIEERGDTPTFGWRVLTSCSRAKSSGLIIVSKKRCFWRRGDWFIAWLAARIRYFYEHFALAMKLLQQAVEWNASHFLLWLELVNASRRLVLSAQLKIPSDWPGNSIPDATKSLLKSPAFRK